MRWERVERLQGRYPGAFADPALQKRFERDGFVVTPLLDQQRLAEVRAVVDSLVPDEAELARPLGDSFDRFFAPYHHDTPQQRREIDATIRSALLPELRRLMPEQKFFLGSLLVKYPGADSYLSLHQDWSFVDERRYVSGVIWVAMQDTDVDNGSLGAVPGSHRFPDVDRGIHPHESPVSPIEPHLRSRVRNLPMAAGSAVVFQNRTVHGSNANHSSEPRIAVGVGFRSADAQLYHFTADHEHKRRHSVTPEFFLDYSPDGPLDRGVLRSEPWDPTHVTLGERDLALLRRAGRRTRRAGAVRR